MPNNPEPVLLELAHLPREQVGPFLLLGLDKEASKEDIEANWAERIKWARKQQTNITLEEINWARDLINDPARRMAADATTLNFDTIEGTLAALARKYGADSPLGHGLQNTSQQGWEPLDEEKQLAGHSLSVDVPDIEATRSAIVVPDIPRQFPAALALLRQVAAAALDPWDVQL
jgi:hypothetical protein